VQLQLFVAFKVVSAAEKVATIFDSIAFSTACHAEGRRFEPRRSRHFNFDDLVRAIYSDCNFLPPYPCKIIR
jgi:hypothetical protein